jgi:predicted transcriptional regulator
VSESNVIFRVDEDLKTAFAEAAKAEDRTTSQVLRELMREYVQKQSEPSDYDAWLARKVEAARKASDEGRSIPSEEVEAYFAERRAAAQRRADKEGL